MRLSQYAACMAHVQSCSKQTKLDHGHKAGGTIKRWCLKDQRAECILPHPATVTRQERSQVACAYHTDGEPSTGYSPHATTNVRTLQSAITQAVHHNNEHTHPSCHTVSESLSLPPCTLWLHIHLPTCPFQPDTAPPQHHFCSQNMDPTLCCAVAVKKNGRPTRLNASPRENHREQ